MSPTAQMLENFQLAYTLAKEFSISNDINVETPSTDIDGSQTKQVKVTFNPTLPPIIINCCSDGFCLHLPRPLIEGGYTYSTHGRHYSRTDLRRNLIDMMLQMREFYGKSRDSDVLALHEMLTELPNLINQASIDRVSNTFQSRRPGLEFKISLSEDHVLFIHTEHRSVPMFVLSHETIRLAIVSGWCAEDTKLKQLLH